MKLLICALALFSVAAGQDMTVCSTTLMQGTYTALISADGDSVTFTVSATTSGWVAVGVSENQVMPNTDIVLGASDGTNDFINDRYATAQQRPNVDTSENITEATAEHVAGVTTITFTRPRTSTGSEDISLDQCRYILYAWGGEVSNYSDPDTITIHSNRGSFPNRVCIPDYCVNGVINCGQLDPPGNGSIAPSNTTAVSEITYSCDAGYRLIGEATRMCQIDGTWSGDAPTCQFINCGQLDPPGNGSIAPSNTIGVSEVTYSCDAGYRLIGEATRMCQVDDTWSGNAPTCQYINCGQLDPPTNGSIAPSNTVGVSEVTYSCDAGYRLMGEATRMCQVDGTWSGEAPTCEEEDDDDDDDGAGVIQSSVTVTALLALIGCLAVFKF